MQHLKFKLKHVEYEINQRARGTHLTRIINRLFVRTIILNLHYSVVGWHELIKGDGFSGLEKSPIW